MASVMIDGAVETMTALATEVTGYQTVYKAASDAEGARTKAVQAREAIAPTAEARVQLVSEALKVALGKHSPDLTTYGVTPEKVPRTLSSAQKQTRAEKADATRKARNTLGSRQKKAIKGVLPAGS
jgi:hypothetical protein